MQSYVKGKNLFHMVLSKTFLLLRPFVCF